MSDYEPKTYYDIQLTKKQIGVLFVAAIAILTLVFFLGLILGKSYMEAKYAQQIKPQSTEVAEYQQKVPKITKEIEPKEPKKEYEFYKLKESSEQPKEEKSNIISPAEQTKEQVPQTPVLNKSENISSSQDFYTLQIHAFKDEKSAISKKEYYRKKGYSVNIIFVENFYKVRIGKFQTKDEAAAFKKKFEQQEKIPAFIVKY